jgi:hypothetical protein
MLLVFELIARCLTNILKISEHSCSLFNIPTSVSLQVQYIAGRFHHLHLLLPLPF